MAMDMDQVMQEINSLEAQFKLPPGSLRSLVQTESNFNPSAVSPAGAVGFTQLMPGTAQEMGVDINDPMQNLQGGAKYFAQQYARAADFTDDPAEQLRMAYSGHNAGPGATFDKYKGVAPYLETQKYVGRNMDNMKKYGFDFSGQEGGSQPAELPSSPTAAATPQPPADKKSSWLTKLMPLLFRFALPTAAGAVIGSKNPFLGGAAGGLMGLTAGGLSQLNAEGEEDKRADALKKAYYDYEVETGKTKRQTAKDERDFGLDKEKLASLKDYRASLTSAKDRSLDIQEANSLSLQDYREFLKNKPTDGTPGTMLPQEKPFAFMKEQFGGQPIADATAPEVRTQVKDFLISIGKDPRYSEEVGTFFKKNVEKIDDEMIDSFINQYNSYVGQAPSTATPAISSGAGGEQVATHRFNPATGKVEAIQ